MAFLRSVARCNSLVSQKLSGSAAGRALECSKFSRSELLASHRYYVELRRELNSRCQSTIAAHKAVGNRAPLPAAGQAPKDALDTTFDDPHAAFKSKTTWELVRAYVVYLMCSSGYLVENNLKVCM